MTGSKYLSLLQSSSIQGGNAPYIEAYYEQFLDDPDSVDPGWREYFRSVQGGASDVAHAPVVQRFEKLARETHRLIAAEAGFDARAAEKQAGVLRLINYFRVRGHQLAKLDPLGLAPMDPIPDLDPAFHGLDAHDMDTVFYTDTIGAEYMYVTETAEKRWIQKLLEGAAFKPRLTAERKKETLKQLVAA